MSIKTSQHSAKKLLRWYDRHARDLPWRSMRGERADPYRVWLSEIMLQQTTVKAVIPYFEKFTRRWPDVFALAKARDEEIMAAWAGLGYYSRARKLIDCARLIAQRGGKFPHSAQELIELPGIGPYTSAAIAAIAFDQSAAVIDGNVERVIARLYALRTPLPQARHKIRALVAALVPKKRAGDFAQGMMDLGSTICTPRNPACPRCPWRKNCKAFAQGKPARYSLKGEKLKRDMRRAAAFWIVRNNAILLRRRPSHGLLGGMSEIPSIGWKANFKPSAAAPPLALPFRQLPGEVAHTFTHFDAQISVFAARVPKKFKAPEGFWWQALNELDAAGLPSVMAKVATHALRAGPGSVIRCLVPKYKP